MDSADNPIDRAPLTLGQERLWFLDRLDPGDPAYNIYLAHRLRGELDVPALQRAFDGVVARHAPLRTRFRTVDGVPEQQVMPPRSVPIDIVVGDEQVIHERTVAPFDLENGPLLRAVLVRLSDNEHVLLTVMHHIASDGWSLGVFYKDLTALYNGQTLEPLAGSYLVHATEKRARAENEEALAYWREQLADPPVLELPTDRPRPAVKTSNGDVIVRSFSSVTTAAMQAFCRELRCTPFMLLLTVFELVLSERSGQDDICVGTPIAGRDEIELEDLIGYFSGVLVLRADLSGSPSLRELVLRTRQGFLKALAHQDIPFERLTAALDLPRDLSRSPLFQTTFTYHSVTPTATTGFDGLEASPFDAGAQHVKVDLSAEVMNEPDAFRLTLSYNTDLFDHTTVEAIADRFAFLLDVFMRQPDSTTAELALVTDEQERLLTDWGTGPALPATTSLLAQIREVDPQAIAVRCGAESVTYAALLTRAADISRDLASAGVKTGNLVAVSVPRGPDLIAAMIAAWQLGAGYVPIDADQPATRRERMLADAGIAAIVTAEGIVATGNAAEFDEPAYVIFTSGSTGVPKPVVIGHQALEARVAWMGPAYELAPGDHIVQFAAAGFDTHAEEIWPALCAGATIVMLPDGPQSLPEVLAARPDITVLDLPTAYWQSLLAMIDEIAWPPALRLVILGGEQVDAAAVSVWRRRFGDSVRLVNTYGPTEATIIATATDLGAAQGRPPIGRPIGGVRLKVCDPYGRLVPPGVPGELLLGGKGLSSGYAMSQPLTAQKFVDGFYRTGDRVRWRAQDATLEFLGRLDKQVKIRGIRVEPGEVEAVLLAHPDVHQAVVTAVDDTLVAYTVGEAATADLKAFAAQRLPAFLVPSVFVPLTELPLTRNGKLDVKALPVPQRERAGDFVAPRTDAEELVASVWSQVLGVEQIGADDNFFDLGGHSLMATRVIASLRSTVDIELPIRALFTHPTVAALATAVEEALIAEIERLTDDEAVVLAGGML